MRSRRALTEAMRYIGQAVRNEAETAMNGSLFGDSVTNEDIFNAAFRENQTDSEEQQQPDGDLPGGVQASGQNPGDGRHGAEPETGSEAEVEPLLQSYTEEDIRAREQAQAAEEARIAEEQRKAEQRAQADAELNDFRLSGSNSPADIAAAGGQSSLFGASGQPSQTEPKSEPPIPEPQNTSEIDALPIHSVYRLNDKYLVRGDGARGGGDTIHQTFEDAKREAEIQRKREEDRRRHEIELEDEVKAEAEAEAAEAADNFNGFADGMNPLQRGRVNKTLNKRINFGDQGVMSIRQRIEAWSDSGSLELSTMEEPKIKPMSRARFNRATKAEQEAHARKMREAGTKTVYLVNGFDLGKLPMTMPTT